MIEIDGSKYEAGGQILRYSLALSLYTQKPFKIIKIRHSRPKPGLKNQHINCISLIKQLSKSKSSEISAGVESLEFFPDLYNAGSASLDIGTAGSITLLLQSIILPAIATKKKTRITISGGTDVSWSPSIDYFKNVYIPQLRRFAEIHCVTKKRGYYPKGNGMVEISIKPIGNPEDVNYNLIKKGKIIQIKGISHASKNLEKSQVADRQALTAKHFLSDLNCPVNIDVQYCDTASTGSGITLYTYFENENKSTNFYKPIIIGNDNLGKKGISSENVAKECASKLKKFIESNNVVDEYMQDQLIPLFIFNDKNQLYAENLTNHSKSAIYVIEKFLNKRIKLNKNIISISTKSSMD